MSQASTGIWFSLLDPLLPLGIPETKAGRLRPFARVPTRIKVHPDVRLVARSQRVQERVPPSRLDGDVKRETASSVLHGHSVLRASAAGPAAGPVAATRNGADSRVVRASSPLEIAFACSCSWFDFAMARIPRARAIPEGFQIAVDTRERYPYRFAGRGVSTERAALSAGDYAVMAEGDPIATVERKTLENLASSLSDGTLAFQMQRLVETPGAAVVVEGRYSGLFKLEHVSGAWLGDMLARLQVRYPEVQVVFADSRKFAEEWTYRFLAAALADSIGSDVAR
jgi:hypothetical protein